MPYGNFDPSSDESDDSDVSEGADKFVRQESLGTRTTRFNSAEADGSQHDAATQRALARGVTVHDLHGTGIRVRRASQVDGSQVHLHLAAKGAGLHLLDLSENSVRAGIRGKARGAPTPGDEASDVWRDSAFSWEPKLRTR